MHKLAELRVLEQRLVLHTDTHREITLLAGRQEILNITKEKLASRLEMLYLSLMKRQETIRKDSSEWILK